MKWYNPLISFKSIFDTLPSTRKTGVGVAIALALENKWYNSRERKYGHLTSWAFNPRRLSWRTSALRGGIGLLNAAVDF